MRRLRKTRQPGYVLVMTLLLVGLCGAILARIAQQGIGQALTAARQADELQAKWAAHSCRLQLLPRAEWLLESAAAESEQAELGWPYPALLAARFRLGGIDCEVVLADEEAKPNLNLLHAQRPEETLLIAGAPFREASFRPLRVKLAPNLIAPGAPEARSFDSWGQVYELAAAGGDLRTLQVASSQLTCWGKNRLNLSRASNRSLELVARLVLNGPEVESLLEARGGYSGDLNEMLKLVDVRGNKKARLRRLLTDRSSCYSMWLATTSGGRTSTHFAIQEAGRRDVPATITFHIP